MSENKVAGRYAKSLFDVAVADNLVDPITDNMDDFLKTCEENPELIATLKSPIVSSKQKSALLGKVFASYGKEVQSFFSLVCAKNRAGFLPRIAEQFLHLYNTHNQILEVNVTSAQALTEKEKSDVIAFLEKETGAKKIIMAEQTNPELIGGMVIKYGDSLIDSSVLSQIKNLKKELQIV